MPSSPRLVNLVEAQSRPASQIRAIQAYVFPTLVEHLEPFPLPIIKRTAFASPTQTFLGYSTRQRTSWTRRRRNPLIQWLRKGPQVGRWKPRLRTRRWILAPWPPCRSVSSISGNFRPRYDRHTAYEKMLKARILAQPAPGPSSNWGGAKLASRKKPAHI